jgi:fused signal recognition particle receptor
MDSLVYIVAALVVAVVLFLVLGKRKPAAAVSAPAPTTGVATSGPATKESKLTEAASAIPGVTDEPSVAPVSVARSEVTTTATSSAAATPGPGPVESKRQPPRRSNDAEIRELQRGLSRARSEEGLFGRLKNLFGVRRDIDPALVSELEDVLLASDVGVGTTQTMLESVRAQLGRGELSDEGAVWSALRREATRLLDVPNAGGLKLGKAPTVVLFVGVNGAGKTTTIGKLATKLKSQGKTCVLAAGDTFRAAAVQQLTIWGQRVGCEVVRGKDGSDPGSVIFEAVRKAQEVGADVVLADTAGRLHTKANLMSEMAKIARTADKALPGAPHEVFLVIDSTNGQNAFAQAKEFKESLELSGIVLTKLDGTAKGGVILGIADALKVPVRYVGLGERPDDLHEFVPEEFVEALLGKDA